MATIRLRTSSKEGDAIYEIMESQLQIPKVADGCFSKIGCEAARICEVLASGQLEVKIIVRSCRLDLLFVWKYHSLSRTGLLLPSRYKSSLPAQSAPRISGASFRISRNAKIFQLFIPIKLVACIDDVSGMIRGDDEGNACFVLRSRA